MARDFKIELDNVEMINGSDDLLKDTKVTKVTLIGENKLNSLNSTFENCTELTVIEGEVNLDGVSDMTEMTLNTTLNEIKVTNPTEENIQADNSLNQVANVKIGGTKYAKGGVQDVVGSLDWNAENFAYEDTILENIYTNSSYNEDSKNLTVSNTLEQKSTSIEIIGQTYTNLVDGKAIKNLLNEMIIQQVEGSPTQFIPHMEQPICLEYIEGNTLQDGIQSIGELIENKNLFDYTQSELGFLSISTGGISSNASWKYTTNLISVKPNTTYCISQASNSEFYYNIVEYNSSQSYSKGTSWEDNNGAISNRIYNSFTTSPNTYYIRLNWKASATEIQLEEGIIPTEFRIFGSVRYRIEIETSDENWETLRFTHNEFYLPQPLRKVGDVKDRFYWDDDKGHYCIEQNVGDSLQVLETPNIIDLTEMNRKITFDTYLPNTSVKVTNLPIQPYSLLLKDDTVRYKATIEPSTLYTIQFNCLAKSTTNLTLDLGGTRVTVDPIIGINHVQITTPSELTSDRLFLIGTGIVVKEVIVNKGNMAQYTKYFDGEQSVGELQDDGSYIIRISTDNYTNLWEGDL